MVYEGQAQAGECLRTPWGEVREVITVICAGDLIESVVERQIALRAPNFMRHSIAATCALYSTSTTGREKRKHERFRAKVNGAKEAK